MNFGNNNGNDQTYIVEYHLFRFTLQLQATIYPFIDLQHFHLNEHKREYRELGTLGNLSCKTDVTHFKCLMTYPWAMLSSKTDQHSFVMLTIYELFLWPLCYRFSFPQIIFICYKTRKQLNSSRKHFQLL